MNTRRFVVLRHEPGEAGPRELHWDLMFEFGDGLRAWSLNGEPRVGEQITATELPRHRSDYLDYEGPVSQGRGTVSQFDRGSFEVVQDSPEQLSVNLDGELLRGHLQLTRDVPHQRWIVLLSPN
ncbi:MAG TPA: DNA polymerase ligase N-terminal domain-containing protein [Pirellulaceae bacterium]|nr:DNA polymerase ligase N-terminal domain-containing protein [Pirellulaceae bacterium]